MHSKKLKHIACLKMPPKKVSWLWLLSSDYSRIMLMKGYSICTNNVSEPNFLVPRCVILLTASPLSKFSIY